MHGMKDALTAAEPFIQNAQLEWAQMATSPVYVFIGAEVLLSFDAAVLASKKAMQSLK